MFCLPRGRSARINPVRGTLLARRRALTMQAESNRVVARSSAVTQLIERDTRVATGEIAVVAEGIGKRYGEKWVLRNVDLRVPRGTVLGLLGPNGAGKTTTVRILTTLLRPDEGRAWVAGYDVLREAARVRPRIGLAGQQATVDELMTGHANLQMIGQLYHQPASTARRRAAELLELFGLSDAGGNLVRTYSGGMRRRLDLAASLVAAPAVLFLDEPTTGLDPRSRIDLWAMLRELVRDGVTLVLTTQYLEEADNLANNVVIVDHGRIIASGSPEQLKRQIGGPRIVLTMHDGAHLEQSAQTLRSLLRADPQIDAANLEITVALAAGAGLIEIARALDEAGIPTADVTLRSPTLDDVFLSLTGQDAEAAEVA
jgi:ABC-2 type transport system ATP-binding protein